MWICAILWTYIFILRFSNGYCHNAVIQMCDVKKIMCVVNLKLNRTTSLPRSLPYYHWKYRFSDKILFVRDSAKGVDVNTVRYNKTGPLVRERYGTWFAAFIINIKINALNLFYMSTLILTMIYNHNHTDSGRLNTPYLRRPCEKPLTVM